MMKPVNVLLGASGRWQIKWVISPITGSMFTYMKYGVLKISKVYRRLSVTYMRKLLRQNGYIGKEQSIMSV